MRLKLITISLWMLVVLLPGLARWPQAQSSGTQTEGSIIMLNVRGVRERGAVRFDHQAHQGRRNSDPNWPFKAGASATCSGCHHTTNEQGVPQLWKCTVCHQNEGKGDGKYLNRRCGQQCDPSGNPKNCQCDELYFERAFHDSCIGCHRANNQQQRNSRAPVTCSGCHAPK
jgi:hypothetical protein